MIFASSDMGLLCFLFVLALAVPAIIKGITEAARKKEEAQLKKDNPKVWLRLKEIEHDKERMAHEQQLEKHQSARQAAGIAAFLIRILTKN
jgi:hypothetical protein